MKTQLSGSLVAVLLALLVAVTALAQKPELVVETGHTSRVSSLAYSADGKMLASGSDDSTIKLWDVATGRELRTFTGHSGEVSSVTFSVNGRTLASGSADHTIRLWDVAAGRELRTLGGHHESVLSVVFTPDGQTLFISDGSITQWDVATGRQLRMISDRRGFGRLALSADGTALASYTDEAIKVWEVPTGRVFRTLTAHSGDISSVALSADGKTLASASYDSTIKLWDVASGRELRTLRGHWGEVFSVAFSVGGALASGGFDNTIKLWDLATGGELRTLKGHSDFVWSVAFSADGKTLASGSQDGTIKLWDMATGRELCTLVGHGNSVNSVAVSVDGKMLADAGGGNTIKLWEVATGRALRTISGHSESIRAIAFSADGRTLASCSSDKTLKLWEVATGRELRTLAMGPEEAWSVAFSADGKWFASDTWGGLGGTIRVWNLVTGELRTFPRHSGLVDSLALSADGQMLAGGMFQTDDINLWDVATGRKLRTLTGHSSSVVAFSANGKILASGGGDGTIGLWDIATGRDLRKLTRHASRVTSVAFSSDGKTLASGSWDHTIKLWEVATGRPLPTCSGHSDLVTSVSLSFDGKFLVSGSRDATTKLWRVDTGELLASLVALDKTDWAVVTPDGRFDTNSLEVIPNLHWLFPDDPFKPLPPEIFMRQYYEPRLLPRLLQDKSFNPVPPLTSLNRVQPEVKIKNVITGPDSKGYVSVSIEVANTRGEQARDGNRVTLNSEVHDLRLFRDGQLVGYVPGKLPLDNTGKATINRAVKLPRRGELSDIEFTAYAFNSDQVKSATSSYTYKPVQAIPAVKGRAYVISVGVNAYEDPAWRLSFAASDARVSEAMLTSRLAATGAYEVVPLTLTSDYQTTGEGTVVTERLATKRNFDTLLALLAFGPEKIDPEIIKQIPGAEKLRKAEPEDLVLVNFSSHGYTDKKGKFYLVPYDTGTEIKSSTDGQEIAAESLARFISSDELSEWIRDIDAGELVMIVDTCHSASAVEEPGFKPGPMGSRGMGQLAYDKGMRILAASQADDVALELDRLKHGLLTYALMEEGLNQKQADKNSDGRIMLDEWLSYGAERVPLLYDDVKAGKLELKTRDARITSLLTGVSVKKNAFQQPRLFDFKRKKREIRLQ